MRRRKLRGTPLPPEPEDGLQSYHGGLYPPEFIERNSRAHMSGFDILPKSIRDQINYAETPELGALPTQQLAPLYRILRALAKERARAAAANILSAIDLTEDDSS